MAGTGGFAAPTYSPKKKSSREQRKSSAKGKQREDAPKDYWKAAAPPYTYGREQFRAWVIRDQVRGLGESISMDSLIEQVQWNDESPLLKGTVTVRKPDARQPLRDVQEGDMIVLEVDRLGTGTWQELWRMRVREPTSRVKDGAVEFRLTDAMTHLALGENDYEFRKGKRRPRGWLGHEIIREAAKRNGVQIKTLVKTKKRYKSFKLKKASFLEVVQKVYKDEREETGLRYVIRMVGGRLSVTTLRRPKHMWLMGPTIIDASVTREAMKTTFATELAVRGVIKASGKRKRRKVHATVTSARLKKRWGMVRRAVNLGTVSSRSELIKEARAKLVELAKVDSEVTFTHQGIVALRRGDSMRLELPEEGLNEVVFVRTVQHTVTSAGYDMEVSLRFSDPYVDKKGEKIREKKEKAREKRKRAGSRRSETERRSQRPKPSNRRQRSDRTPNLTGGTRA